MTRWLGDPPSNTSYTTFCENLRTVFRVFTALLGCMSPCRFGYIYSSCHDVSTSGRASKQIKYNLFPAAYNGSCLCVQLPVRYFHRLSTASSFRYADLSCATLAFWLRRTTWPSWRRSSNTPTPTPFATSWSTSTTTPHISTLR